MKWEDVVKKDVEELGGESDWKAWTINREGWKAGCMIEWDGSIGRKYPKKSRKLYLIIKAGYA